MTEIIMIIILFISFIVLLALVISNEHMRRKGDQPSLLELEKQFKIKNNMATNKISKAFSQKENDKIVFKPAMASVLMMSVATLLVVSSDIMKIINNGPNPCDVKKINFKPSTDCLLEISNEDFWSCI